MKKWLSEIPIDQKLIVAYPRSSNAQLNYREQWNVNRGSLCIIQIEMLSFFPHSLIAIQALWNFAKE